VTNKALSSNSFNSAESTFAEMPSTIHCSSLKRIPANFNTFLYVLRGDAKVGDDQKFLQQDQVGWLDIFKEEAQSELKLTSGEDRVRFVLHVENQQVHQLFHMDLLLQRV